MYSRAYKAVISAPPLLWVCVFLLLPYALMFAHSFWFVRDGFLVHHWNLQNYRALFTNPLYFQVFLRTARIAASVTLCSLLLGYLLAYYLSFHAGPRKELLYQLVVVPLWVSYLVRGYAWKTILGSDGVLNGLLQYLHITHEPVSFFLYSPFAVVLMLTHIYTPFVFLPIYAALEHIPRPLIDASPEPRSRSCCRSAISSLPCSSADPPLPCSPTSCKAFSALRTTGRWAPLFLSAS